MDSNTPSEEIESREKAIEDDVAKEESVPAKPEESPPLEPQGSAEVDSGETSASTGKSGGHEDSEDAENAKHTDDSEKTPQNSSHEDDDSAQEQTDQAHSDAVASSKPKRLSRLAENDKPPEDPKFRFLSDPERDGKGVAAAEESKDAKDGGKQKDGDRQNRKKVSRIPSARRGNRGGAGQCENCGGCQNARRPHEDPAGEERRDRSFQRNTRERNSYPGPRRNDSRADDQQKWGHAMYYELYGEEQARPQRPRRRGRGEYHGGGAPRDFNNNRHEHRSEGSEGNLRYNGNRRPETNPRGDRFGGPRRQDSNDDPNVEKQDENAHKNRPSYGHGNNNGGERGEHGGRRGQGSFRGRGSFRRRNNQKPPSTEKREGESVPAAAAATA